MHIKGKYSWVKHLDFMLIDRGFSIIYNSMRKKMNQFKGDGTNETETSCSYGTGWFWPFR